MDLRGTVKRTLQDRGWELSRIAEGAAGRRQQLLERFDLRTVVDVGANVGQYAQQLRAAGFAGDIWSFEPLPEASAQLDKAARNDPGWRVQNVALGNEAGSTAFHVSSDGVCSSVLAPTETLVSSIPQAQAVETIEVPVRRLDSFSIDGEVLLKIDTQGFEHQVLDGAAGLLPQARVLEIEMALVPLYEGGSSIYNLLPRLHDLGYQALTIEPGFVDPSTGQTLDVDVLLVRR